MKETLVRIVENRAFDWFLLHNGEYIRIVPMPKACATAGPFRVATDDGGKLAKSNILHTNGKLLFMSKYEHPLELNEYFRDPIINAINDLLDALPGLNVTSDAALAAITDNP